MVNSRVTYLAILILANLTMNPTLAIPRGQLVFQFGGFSVMQGRAQLIGIDGLIGDYFNVTSHQDQNILLGVGYFLDGVNKERFRVQFGINAFYLANTEVQGTIDQEILFTNLSYRYAITHVPIYLTAKTIVPVNDKYDITIDLGLGPNFMQTSSFSESSLDGGITIPEQVFNGQLNIAFSASAGIGFRINKLIGSLPLELGYRFLYLGQGSLAKTSSQLSNNLNTGNSYANALVISTSFN